MTGLLKIRTTKEFGESTVSKILDLVENSSPRNQDPRTLFPNLQNIIHRQSAMVRWHWQSCRRWYECCLWELPPEWSMMDLPSTDIPGYQLPVCTGDQYSAQLLCRNRRSKS